ncbi:calcium homeostasis modulator protein 5 isoform X2 [Hirundo rustica]|uniref:calcium homeostasis modulator protein 5 isoform X2 n=1 Tax=Hirundo rustica TaxID=43150 RepID=UPI001A9502CE|nr:calcium homeostasis modulator protein 5 isoform X2 [Hirundo rustica]
MLPLMCDICPASGGDPCECRSPGSDITALCARLGVGGRESGARLLLGRALPCCTPRRNCLPFLLLNARAAMKTSGCWVNPRKIFPRGNVCHFFYVFGQITLNALVAPVMWLSVALLNGTFYECAMSGLKNPAYLHAVCNSKSEKCFEELHKVACDKSSLPFSESDELKRTLQAQSQILGWCVIVTTALLSLLTTCCASCQSKVSHLQLMFWRVYEGTEKEQLEQIFQLYATKLSERNLKCFFENKEPEPISLPAFQAWEDASQLYSFSSSKQHYSTIHRLVEEGQKGSSEEGETMLDFADRREIP